MSDYIRANENIDSQAVVGSDRDNNAEFYMHPRAGVPYCRMVFGGDKTKEWDQPVRDIDKKRYPVAWANFEQGLERFHGQTRLEEWAAVDEGLRRHLNYNNIFTVEQVAGISDSNLDTLGPGSLEIRAKAQEMIAEKEKQAAFEPMQAEINELRAQIAAMQTEQPKRRGRPPKNKEEAA